MYDIVKVITETKEKVRFEILGEIPENTYIDVVLEDNPVSRGQDLCNLIYRLREEIDSPQDGISEEELGELREAEQTVLKVVKDNNIQFTDLENVYKVL